MESFFAPEFLLSILSLTFLEIVLGIDNLIFIQVITGNVAPGYKSRVRKLGLLLALLLRILMLSSVTYLVGLSYTLFQINNINISWKGLILIGGGLFLLTKGTLEIHSHIEGDKHIKAKKIYTSFFWAILQIGFIDIIFSLDSVIMAIGMTNNFSAMVIAIVISMVVMVLAADTIGNFVQKYRTIKMLALMFLILVGLALIMQGLEVHIPKGYLYFAIFFSVSVEALNIFARKYINLDQEVKNIIKQGAETGDFIPLEQIMIKNIIHLGDHSIKNYFIPIEHLEWIDINITAKELKQKLSSFKSPYIMIYEGTEEHIKGIASIHDLWKELLTSTKFSLNNIIKAPEYIVSDLSALKILETLHNNDKILIISTQNKVEGVVGRMEIFNKIMKELPVDNNTEE